MKYLILVLALCATSVMARDVYVQPHTTKNGTYVQGHYRTAPDSSQYNNFSSQGNTNPYTGQEGRIAPDPFGNTTMQQQRQRNTPSNPLNPCPFGQRC